MSHYVDDGGVNPHVNYEPSSTGGLHEAGARGKAHEPEISGRLTRATIARTNDYAQAGERYRTISDWEREDLVRNLVDMLGQCEEHIQERMIRHFARCDEGFAGRIKGGLGLGHASSASAARSGAAAG